jgi:hypothetical protein
LRSNALDDAADELARARLVRLDHLLALGLAHLSCTMTCLRGLSRDAPELDRLHRLLDEPPTLGLSDRCRARPRAAARDAGSSISRESSANTFPAAETSRSFRSAVDRDAHLDVVAVALSSSADASAASIASKMTYFSTPFSFETASPPSKSLCSYRFHRQTAAQVAP